MPRRRRGLLDHSCYHVTHRCHEREFLFRFARDRQAYVELLRETLRRFKVDVLNYAVTSNHVHLLFWVRRGPELSRAMQFQQGEFGQYYNKRKSREGAFWRDRYHSTLIETGAHLARCLFYLDLNMVRAGAVSHPREWPHGGHHELSGTRQRYRIVNVPRLMKCLGHPDADVGSFREWYMSTLTQKLAARDQVREPYWSEAFAVGNPDWLQRIYRHFKFKRKRILSSPPATAMYGDSGKDAGARELAETSATYYIEG